MTDDQRPGRPPAEATTKGWVVARLAGAPVVITPSWFLAAAVLTVLFAPTVHYRAPQLATAGIYLVALCFVLLLFGSVFLHEVAHALVARARGHRVQELALTLWGGHTAYSGGTDSPFDAFLVAVVGPLTNLALAGGFWAAYLAAEPSSVLAVLLYAAAFSNAFVGAFNLLPGLPLDGGQILESVVWAVTGRRDRGTVAAGWAGRVVAVALVAWAVLLPLARGQQVSLTATVWTVVIATFLWSGATQAVGQGRTRAALAPLAVTDLLVPAGVVPATASVADARRVAVAGVALVVVDAAGAPVAVVEPGALAAVPAEHAAGTPLSAASVPLPPGTAVPLGTRGLDVLEAVRGVRSPVLAVVDGPRVVGILPVAAVAQAVNRAAGRR